MNTARCLVVAFALVMLATLPASSESIQLEQRHGIYMVPVRINDAVAIPFVLDSGASDVVIPEDVFSVLRRSGTVSQSDFVGTANYNTADGSSHSSERYVLHKMVVGNHVITNVIATVVSVKGDPLLGQTFLARLPAWTIDNAQHALVFSNEGPQQTPARPSLPQPSQGTPPPIPSPPPVPPKAGLSIAELLQRAQQALDGKDYVQAMQWDRIAADQGNVIAQRNIGFLYDRGLGVAQDYSIAILWYRRAADQGYAPAQFDIGMLYANGWGVAKDCAIAKQWLERAAATGDRIAQANLRNGVYGVCPW